MPVALIDPKTEEFDMTVVADRALYSIFDTMAMLSMSRSVVYEQIRAGRLQTVHQGRRCYVTSSAIERYVALLEAEAEAEADGEAS
jgi:hypothetical protein